MEVDAGLVSPVLKLDAPSFSGDDAPRLRLAVAGCGWDVARQALDKEASPLVVNRQHVAAPLLGEGLVVVVEEREWFH